MFSSVISCFFYLCKAAFEEYFYSVLHRSFFIFFVSSKNVCNFVPEKRNK